MERRLRKLLPMEMFTGVSPVRSRTMGAIRSRRNRTTEMRFMMMLVRARVTGWKLHVKSLPGTPDFFFAGKRLAVFVDGCFWHGCPRCGHIPKTRNRFWEAKLARNQQRDRSVCAQLRKQGVRVVRFWEHSLKKGAPSIEIERFLMSVSKVARS